MYAGQMVNKNDINNAQLGHTSRMSRLNAAVMHVMAGAELIRNLSNEIVGAPPEMGSGATVNPTPHSFIGMMDENIDRLNALGDLLLMHGTLIKEAL